jgi:hypothetical protein
MRVRKTRPGGLDCRTRSAQDRRLPRHGPGEAQPPAVSARLRSGPKMTSKLAAPKGVGSAWPTAIRPKPLGGWPAQAVAPILPPGGGRKGLAAGFGPCEETGPVPSAGVDARHATTAGGVPLAAAPDSQGKLFRPRKGARGHGRLDPLRPSQDRPGGRRAPGRVRADQTRAEWWSARRARGSQARTRGRRSVGKRAGPGGRGTNMLPAWRQARPRP